MPDGWTPNFTAFQDGLEVGLYATFAVLAALIVLAAVRRVLAV